MFIQLVYCYNLGQQKLTMMLNPMKRESSLCSRQTCLVCLPHVPFVLVFAEVRILKEIGTMVKIHYWCTEEKCSYTNVWFNQPFLRGRMPVGNLLLSCSILLSGEWPVVYVAQETRTRY